MLPNFVNWDVYWFSVFRWGAGMNGPPEYGSQKERLALSPQGLMRETITGLCDTWAVSMPVKSKPIVGSLSVYTVFKYLTVAMQKPHCTVTVNRGVEWI